MNPSAQVPVPEPLRGSRVLLNDRPAFCTVPLLFKHPDTFADFVAKGGTARGRALLITASDWAAASVLLYEALVAHPLYNITVKGNCKQLRGALFALRRLGDILKWAATASPELIQRQKDYGARRLSYRRNWRSTEAALGRVDIFGGVCGLARASDFVEFLGDVCDEHEHPGDERA